MVKEKNKKKKKDKRAGSVERALVPSPVFAAVPHSATSPAAIMSPSASKSPAASPRLLGQQPPAQSPTDEFSEPESSLFDYQHMDEAGYMTVGFGTWPARGRQMRREPERPPSGYRSSGLYAEPGDIQDFKEEEKSVVKMISDIYATPVKKGKGKSSTKSATGSGADDDKSMTGTQKDVRAEMKKIHDMPPEVSDVMSRSTRRSANISYSHPGSSQIPDSGRGSSRPDSLADDPPNLDPSSELLQSHVMQTQEAESGGRSSRSQASYSIRDATDGVEVEQMKMQSAEMQSELQELRKIVASMHDGDIESAKALHVQRQVGELKDENEVLKSAVHRLNIELSDYQAKYRPVDTDLLKQTIEIHGLPSNGPVPSWLISKKYLAPLFLAYDDHLANKTKVIEQSKKECAAIKKRVEEVVKENQMLRMAGGAGLGGHGDSVEWLQLQEQARLVLEENQVLMEQLEVQLLKSQDMHKAHQAEISRMARKLALSEGDKAELERDLEQQRVRFREMKHKHDQLLMESGSHVNVQAQISMVAELKKSVAEEKEQAEKEVDAMRVRLKAAEHERKQQAMNMIDLTAENKSLKAEIKAMQKSVRHAQEKIASLYRAIELSENKEMVVQEQLANVIRVAEKTALERDTVYKVAREQQEEGRQTVNKMMQGSAAAGKLELKLKLWRMKASARFNTVAEKLVEQEEAFNSQRKEYEREIQHLRSLLREKEDIIESLEKDKKDIERDLDTMWQAANSENKRVKNILLGGSRKLKEHAHIADALQQEMENDELLHFSDDTKD